MCSLFDTLQNEPANLYSQARSFEIYMSGLMLAAVISAHAGRNPLRIALRAEGMLAHTQQ